MSYSIIGGSDGPTSIFLAGTLGVGWINIFNSILVYLDTLFDKALDFYAGI